MEAQTVSREFSDLENRLDSTIMDERGFIEKSSDIYFAPKSFEKSGKVYESIGIRSFKKLIMKTAGKSHAFICSHAKEEGSNYFIGKDRSLKGLMNFESASRCNELVHIICELPIALKVADDVSKDDYPFAIADSIIFLVNTYCILLQRYNRARVYDVLMKKEESDDSFF